MLHGGGRGSIVGIAEDHGYCVQFACAALNWIAEQTDEPAIHTEHYNNDLRLVSIQGE